MMICEAWEECMSLRRMHGVRASHHCAVHEGDPACGKVCPFKEVMGAPMCRKATDEEMVFHKMAGGGEWWLMGIR